MLIPSKPNELSTSKSSLSRRVNANSQPNKANAALEAKLIKKGEC